MTFLLNWCRISETRVLLDDELFLESGETGGTDILTTLYQRMETGYPRFYKMDRLSQAAFLGVELLKKACPALAEAKENAAGLVFANSETSSATDARFRRSYEVEKLPGPSLFVYTLPNIAMGEIAIRNKWYGENMFAVFPNFAPGYFADFTEILLAQDTELVIGGWLDAGKKTDILMFVAGNTPGSRATVFTGEQLLACYRK